MVGAEHNSILNTESWAKYKFQYHPSSGEVFKTDPGSDGDRDLVQIQLKFGSQRGCAALTEISYYIPACPAHAPKCMECKESWADSIDQYVNRRG